MDLSVFGGASGRANDKEPFLENHGDRPSGSAEVAVGVTLGEWLAIIVTVSSRTHLIGIQLRVSSLMVPGRDKYLKILRVLLGASR